MVIVDMRPINQERIKEVNFDSKEPQIEIVDEQTCVDSVQHR
jgi:hypothetical protein